MSLYKKTGTLLFGTRLKRLSDKFFNDLSIIYADQGIRFEASWFPVFYLLSRHKEVTISKVAGELEITHPGASQIVTALKKKGFVNIQQNKEDKRVKKVILTNAGKEKLSEIKPVWRALLETMHELPRSEGASSKALELLEELEDEMDRVDLVDLVEKKLQFNRFLEKIEIVPYAEAYHEGLMALALNWIAENPDTIQGNMDWINQTHKLVYESQTHVILLAVLGDRTIAACAAAIDAPTQTARLTLIFEKEQISDQIIQILLDKTSLELEKKGITEITASVETASSNILKLYQKNNFKLKEIEEGATVSFAQLYKIMG
ncbi:transcriptional regulator, MarR family with acetyltransferase activity [Desulfocicer vacuolatum DSM 3385]|uniref:Transcriptional regulator, MarR family with acetyltransferase activity n=2 Tax=Desulfocicer vacuolatum TaxID=2298 RepID=A0A1W2EKP8_9BACT|nr:transcriptional regulator, MarR family with acetyltransferase activity [Desulfocicer vacuolatum DSM 3385]